MNIVNKNQQASHFHGFANAKFVCSLDRIDRVAARISQP